MLTSTHLLCPRSPSPQAQNAIPPQVCPQQCLTLAPSDGESMPPQEFKRVWQAANVALANHPGHPQKAALMGWITRHAQRMLGLASQDAAATHTPDSVQELYDSLPWFDTIAVPDSLRRQAHTLLRTLQHDSFAQITKSACVPKTHAVQHMMQALPDLTPMVKCKALKPSLITTDESQEKSYFVSSVYVGACTAFLGFMASSVTSGGYCKIKPMLGPHGQAWVARMLRLDAPKSHHITKATPKTNYRKERAALHAAQSDLAPKHTLFDGKGRLYEIIDRFDGDLLALHAHPMDLFEQSPLLLYVAQAMLQNLARVHASGWVHRDVKPDNMLWRRDGHMALGDFGLAERIGAPQTYAGTLNYLPPEVVNLRDDPVAPAQDIFSLGLSLLILASPEFDLAYSHNVMTTFETNSRQNTLGAVGQKTSHYHASYAAWAQAHLFASGSQQGRLMNRPHASEQSAKAEQAYWRKRRGKPFMAGWAQPGDILRRGPYAGTAYASPAKPSRYNEWDRASYALRRIDVPLADLILTRMLHPEPAKRCTAEQALQVLHLHTGLGLAPSAELLAPLAQASQTMPSVRLMDELFVELQNLRAALPTP